MKKEKVVLIEWNDSCADTSGWRPKEHYEREVSISKCETIGYVLKHNKTSITVFQSRSLDTGNISELMTIPSKAITKVTYLRSE